MMVRTVRGSVFFAVVLTLASFGLLASPASAGSSYAVKGTVRCNSGKAVRGIWIQSSAGGSVWANWFAFPGRPYEAYYSKTVTLAGTATSSTIALHIGCGSNANGSWWSNNHTPDAALKASRTLNAVCPATVAGTVTNCTWPPKGQTVTYNQGDPGWCTWGAYEKWRAATGYYPNIGGNAIDMDNNAAAKGWRVLVAPSVRAMVVFNTGTLGHVGWVTGIRKDSAGKILIDFVDMNGGSLIPGGGGKTTDFNKFVNRTRYWDSAVQRFIQATA